MKNSRKGKQRNKYRKNVIGLKKLKLLKREKKKGRERKTWIRGKLHRTVKIQCKGRIL